MNKKQVLFDNLKKYKNGWIIGAFQPNIFYTQDFEIALMHFKKGQKSDNHYHLYAEEYNILISGSCIVTTLGINYNLCNGDIFIFPKGVKTNVEYTSDTDLVVIKVPSVPGDKHYDQKNDD